MTDSRRCSLFVGNLDPSTTDEEFLAYFRVQSFGVRPGSEGGKIVRDGQGRSKRYGFVNFVDSSSADRVVAKKNHIIKGKKVICKIQNRKRKPVALNTHKTEPKYLREIHVRNLNVSTTNQQLREYFQKFGPIINAYIALDESKRSKGFGFVEYKSSSGVENVQDKRPHIISNKEVQTSRSHPHDVPTHLKKATTVLFVLNLNDKVREENIEEYFGEFGNITLVSCHKKKRPDTLEDFKYLELHFDDYDAVDKICLADISTNHTIDGCTVKVTKCLEDGLKETSKSAGNLNSVGMVSAPVPTAPLFPTPTEDLVQSPYNPYFVNHQQTSYPSLQTQTQNPQPGSFDNIYANVRPYLYPSFDTNSANSQSTQQNTAPNSAKGSVGRPPARPPVNARPERRKEDCTIL